MKSQDLIPLIIEANTQEKAVEVLRNTLKILHLSTEYVEMNKFRERLDYYQKEFKTISQTRLNLKLRGKKKTQNNTNNKKTTNT